MEAWKEELYHSWGPWKKHKYIKKVGNRYIYKETNTRSSSGKGLFGMRDSQEMAKDNATLQDKIDQYVWNKSDASKSAIGKGMSKVARFLRSGKADEQVSYFTANGKKVTMTKTDYEKEQAQKKEDFAKRWEKDSGQSANSQMVSRSMPSSSSSNRPVSRKKKVVSGGTGVKKTSKSSTKARYGSKK